MAASGGDPKSTIGGEPDQGRMMELMANWVDFGGGGNPLRPYVLYNLQGYGEGTMT